MVSLSEIEDLEQAAAMAAKVDFAGAPGPVAADAAVRIERARNMLDAAEANALSAVDASKEYAREGHKTAGAWLKGARRLPKETANRRVKLARKLRSMPETAAALAVGEITSEHVGVLAGANRPKVAELFAEAEGDLVDAARRFSFRDFCQVVRYWEAIVDPDDHERDAQRAEAMRSLHCSETLDGMGRLDATMDPVSRAVFQAELDRREQELFEDDWKEARERLGEAATKDDLLRTPAQRRHDALIEMAKASADHGARGNGPTPVLNLHMDWATFCAEVARHTGTLADDVAYPDERICELDDGTVIPPSQMLALALRGHIRRVVFGDDGHILDFGRRKRLFTGALRDAIAIRDRTCFHESCDVPSRKCQIDHHPPWSLGGTTSERGGRAACGFHNRWDYNHRWRC